MFSQGDGGVGFQLELYRWADAFKEARSAGREKQVAAYVERLVDDYNRLLGYTQDLERKLKLRDEQLAASEALQRKTQAQLDYQTENGRRVSNLLLDRSRELRDERDLRMSQDSQTT